MIPSAELAELVRRRMDELDISFRRAAQLTGVPYSTINRITKGRQGFKSQMETLKAISEGLDIPYDEIERAVLGLGDEGEDAKPPEDD